MAGFIRRFTTIPTLEVIRQIEGVVIIDLAPPEPATGAGTGTVLLVGEFEDGYFATDSEINGSLEVFGSEDLRQKFGDFGYTYGTSKYQNPCARKHVMELWNGNGWLKAFKLKAQRLLIARVDTSVGQVTFDIYAAIAGAAANNAGPFAVVAADTLDVTTDAGSASSDAITATVATVAGSGQAFASIVGGDAFSISVDGGVSTTVTFGAADINQAAVIARINSTLGYTAAVANLTEVDLQGIQAGSGGSVVLVDTVAGTLAKLGHSAGTTAGTGNVANVNAVTVTELVSIINGSATLTAIQVKAQTGPDGELQVYNNVIDPTSSVKIDSGGGLEVAGFTAAQLDTAVLASDHAAFTIPAGTRVTDSTTTYVTMQTQDVAAAAVDPITVKVRPATDDGTAVGATAGTVTTLTDPVENVVLTVNNAAALSAAKTEPQMDSAYTAAFNATLDEKGPAREANYLLCARRSDAVVRDGRSNAVTATECALFARKFITGDPLGTSTNDIITNVANFRSDRVFYVGKGLKVRVPQIAEIGSTGGTGFTDDGIITVRPDGPLCTICATLPPEENPGQQTGLIDDFFEVDSAGETLTIDSYEAYRANGVAVPRNDRQSGMIFQSGVTSSLESGKKNMARRKMADFIQDTAAELFNPYVKRLSKQSRRDKIRGIWEDFLDSLKSELNAELARIEDYSVDDSINAGNTPAVLALGVYYLQTVVRTFASLDDIVIQTEIGENAVISSS